VSSVRITTLEGVAAIFTLVADRQVAERLETMLQPMVRKKNYFTAMKVMMQGWVANDLFIH
jgi:hypothetical protein